MFIHKHLSFTKKAAEEIRKLAYNLHLSESEVARRGIRMFYEHMYPDEAYREDEE